MNKLVINKVITKNNKIEYDYELNGQWKKLLKDDNRFFMEYDINIEEVPDGILVIPFLSNILPISWVYDLEIVVEEIDKKFYESIEQLKKGYQNMHPNIKMLGKITVNNVKENSYDAINSGVLFSGGVDAFNTLFMNIDEKPMLLTSWGSDISLEDEKGWDVVKQYNIKIAKQFDLKYSFVKSNFRTFFEYGVLSKYVTKLVNDEWWHGFQHGIGLLGQMAPIAYINKFKKLYIASSYTKEDKGMYTCASDPTIDNYFEFASCKTVHDGYEFNRQDKIYNICKYLDKTNQKNIKLRVCWQSNGGENCCKCEKCYRTILGIIAEKKDPNHFGFNITEDRINKILKKTESFAKYDPTKYLCIQRRMKENYNKDQISKNIRKFTSIEILKEKPKYIKYIEKIKEIFIRVKNKIKH